MCENCNQCLAFGPGTPVLGPPAASRVILNVQLRPYYRPCGKQAGPPRPLGRTCSVVLSPRGAGSEASAVPCPGDLPRALPKQDDTEQKCKLVLRVESFLHRDKLSMLPLFA